MAKATQDAVKRRATTAISISKRSFIVLAFLTDELSYVRRAEVGNQALDQIFELRISEARSLSRAVENDVGRRSVGNVLRRVKGVSPDLSSINANYTTVTFAGCMGDSELISSVSAAKPTREISRRDTREGFRSAGDSDRLRIREHGTPYCLPPKGQGELLAQGREGRRLLESTG
jgi:hypothetical protein